MVYMCSEWPCVPTCACVRVALVGRKGEADSSANSSSAREEVEEERREARTRCRDGEDDEDPRF